MIVGSLPSADGSGCVTPQQMPVVQQLQTADLDNSSGECSSTFDMGSGLEHGSPSFSRINVTPCESSQVAGTANVTGIASKFQDRTGARKVAVSVHDDRHIPPLTPSYSIKSSEAVEILRDIVKTPEYTSATVTKSTSGDTQISLGTPVSATEVAAALLGASNTSLSSIQGSGFRGRHRRVGPIGEDDLSTPYNHYRCLSPNEHYGMQYTLLDILLKKHKRVSHNEIDLRKHLHLATRKRVKIH